jgi:hypothetical protein
MTFRKPEGLILAKGDDWAVYGIWPSGYVRQITAAEWTLWGSPPIDYQIPSDAPDQVAQLAAYDRALRA